MLNKKGSVIDIAFLIVVVIGLSIFILVVGKVFPAITAQIKTTDIGKNPNSVNALNMTEKVAGKGDMIFLFMFSGLSIAVFITSFFIDSSPIFIPIYIIALALLLIVAVVAENIYTQYAETPEFSQIAQKNKIVDYLMRHLLMVSIAVGVISMALMFAKPKGYGGGGF